MVSREIIRKWYPLFLISAVSLFLEMAVIRWVSGEVRLLSYFKNLPLLAAFLGLGIGFALVGKGRNYQRAFAPLLGLFVTLTLVVGRVVSHRALAYPGSADEWLWFTGEYSYLLALALFLGVVLLFFLTTMFLFIPLGQATGEEMARHDPVPAYIVNLLASLVGIWAFAFLSYLQTPPALWFAVAVVGIGVYIAVRGELTSVPIAIFGTVIVALALLGQDILWSPYHRLETHKLYFKREDDNELVNVGYTLKVQQVFYQVAIDLSNDFLAELQGEIPVMEEAAFSYNLPYLVSPNVSELLIVGAGMGNDASAALRNHANRVDAVEIDPVILELGSELHPESPYQDPRVTLIVEDARSFFEKNTIRYDMIVFGFLDSHTLLSGFSSVRLDSFVYTLDSFKQVKEHLTEDGVVSVSFSISTAWIEERLGRMLADVFGPGKVFIHRGTTGTTFVAGLISSNLAVEHDLVEWKPTSEFNDLPLPTDDWPYLYLQARKIPEAYWQTLLIIALIIFVLLARTFPAVLRPNWHFWLLGAAFLLVEFKSITEMALLFGTTWIVNVLAISGVLLMALGANLVVLRRKYLNIRYVYVLLFLSLGLNYLSPLDLLIGLSPTIRAIGSMILLSIPLFFAGLIFGESLRRAGETAGPLASNLSGSVAGGVLEYGSILWGIKSLYLIAAVIYFGSLLAFLSKRR